MFKKLTLAGALFASAIACSNSSESGTEAVSRHVKECRVGDFMVRFSGELPSSIEIQGAADPIQVKYVMDLNDADGKTHGRVYRTQNLYVEMNQASDKISLSFYDEGRTYHNGTTSLSQCK